jgi:hypothetical protein
MYDVAHEAVGRLLATHRPEPLPDDIRQRLLDVVTRVRDAAA